MTRQLKKEIRRRTKAESENKKNEEKIRNYEEIIKEKEKQLNYTNIYVQRQNRKSKKSSRYVNPIIEWKLHDTI